MLFPIFVVVTIAEIAVLISVGEVFGTWPTVLLVIITALIGSTLLKQQGWSTMAKAQQSLAEGRSPAVEMLEGVVILVSGVLLLTPGFLTDGLGLLGLIPWSRLYFINHFLEKNAVAIFLDRKYWNLRFSENIRILELLKLFEESENIRILELLKLFEESENIGILELLELFEF